MRIVVNHPFGIFVSVFRAPNLSKIDVEQLVFREVVAQTRNELRPLKIGIIQFLKEGMRKGVLPGNFLCILKRFATIANNLHIVAHYVRSQNKIQFSPP